MKKNILSICLIILVKLLSGQDIIVKLKGDSIKANITEATSEKVIYQLADSSNTTTYHLMKSVIHKIIYKNGQTKIFNEVKKSNGNTIILDSTITKNGKKYYQFGEELSTAELKAILATNPATVPDMQKYQAFNIIGSSFAYIGSIGMVTITVLDLSEHVKQSKNVFYQKTNYLPMLIPFVAIGIVGLPFVFIARHHFNESIKLYNSSYKNVANNPIKINFMVNNYGLGIRMVF